MIFFRADGNSAVGAGHIMRCLSIASQAKDMGEDICFYTAGAEFSKIIEEKNIKNMVMHSDFMKMESELVYFISEILREKPGVLFVDSYYVTKRYLTELMNACHSYGGKLVYIDDVLEFAYPCDYLVNYNIYGPDKKTEYIDMYESQGLKNGKEGFPEFILGTEYVPLRREFCNLSPRIVREKPRDILVSTGGADSMHIAVSVVRQVLTIPAHELDNLRFHILIGVMNSDKDEIETLSSGCKNIELHFNVRNMVSLMQKCDVAISAAGSTLYELCATQTPTITYVVADNQILGAEGFSKAGVMENIGDVREIGSDELAKRLVTQSMKLIKSSNRYKRITIMNGAKNILLKVLKK